MPIRQMPSKAWDYIEGDAALYFSGTVDLTNARVTVGETQKGGVAIGSNGMLIVDASVSKGDDTKNPVTTVTGRKSDV